MRAFCAITLCFVINAAFAQSNKTSLIDPGAIDNSVSACDNFYQHACGTWIKNTKLAANESHIDRGFSAGGPRKIAKQLQVILQRYADGKFKPDVPYAKKMGDFYQSCMDTAAIEKSSQEQVQRLLDSTNKLDNKKDIPKQVAKLQLIHANVFNQIDYDPDFDKPKMQLAKISQGGLGLPNSAYYLSKDKQNQTIRQQYKQYISKLFTLSGLSKKTAQSNAQTVLNIETTLAQNSLPPQDLHNLATLYHPMDIKQLQALSKQFNWSDYFNTFSIPIPKVINVMEPNFIKGINQVVQKYSLDNIKVYLQWHILQALAPYLSSDYANASFQFEQKTLLGIKSMALRPSFCESTVNTMMGDALGHAYVKKYFDERSRSIAQDMMKNIISAFKQNLIDSDWLDNPTRKAALEKLKLVQVNVGYPDKWRDFDGLKINRDSFLDNMLSTSIYQTQWVLSHFDKSTDRGEWQQLPQDVDAANIRTTNTIEISAGILNPPYFSPDAPLAQNYGGIGVVLGHELIHGFDTSGRNFDGYGKLTNWWTKKTTAQYLKKVKCLEDQYSAYTVLPGVHVNGKLTITENIADAGGMKLANEALKLAIAAENKTLAQDDVQQLFLTFGQGFCSIGTNAYYRNFVSGNPHSPPRFRVNGVVVDSTYFPPAFNCPQGKCPMAPTKRCEVW